MAQGVVVEPYSPFHSGAGGALRCLDPQGRPASCAGLHSQECSKPNASFWSTFPKFPFPCTPYKPPIWQAAKRGAFLPVPCPEGGSYGTEILFGHRPYAPNALYSTFWV